MKLFGKQMKIRHYMTGVAILIGIMILLYIYNNRHEYLELFSNTIPILSSYECMASNKRIIKFIKDMNSIFDKYKIEFGEIEASVKFSENDINVGRIVAFIPKIYLDQSPDIQKECYKVARIPEEVQVNLDSQISNGQYQKAQLLLGIDEGEKSVRAYLNTFKDNKTELIGYNIDDKRIAKKTYNQLKFMDFKEKCEVFIGHDLYIKLLDVFPVQTWKMVGCKNDSRIPGNKYSTFYINLNFEYKLSQFDEKLFILLGAMYKGRRKELDKFYNCYKDNNVTWVAIGKNEQGNYIFTMYFVYNRFIRKTVNFNKVAKLRSYLSQMKKEFEKKKIKY